jgi:hypothetical protein
VPRLLQAKSEEHPLIQVADLCGGLAVFSREVLRLQGVGCCAGRADGLFTGLPLATQASRSDVERFPVVHHLREHARKASAFLGLMKRPEGIHRQLDRGMPELVLEPRHIDARLQQQRRVGVPAIVAGSPS